MSDVEIQATNRPASQENGGVAQPAPKAQVAWEISLPHHSEVTAVNRSSCGLGAMR